MNWTATIARWLGHENVSSIDALRLSFGSGWAYGSPFLVLLGGAGLALLAVVYYARGHSLTSRPLRLFLTTLRALILLLVLVILTDPTLELTWVRIPKPVLWLLFDGSDSMSIADDLPAPERDELDEVVDFDAYQKVLSTAAATATKSATLPPHEKSRAEYVRALLSRPQRNLIQRLSERFQLRAFTFAGPHSVRSLPTDEAIDGRAIARSWQATGNLTALGDAFEELSRQHFSDSLAAVLVFSDFDQNVGLPAIAAAKKLAVPVYTVGIGPITAADLSIELLAPPTMKRGESSTIQATVRQKELDHPTVRVRLFAQPPSDGAGSPRARTLVGEATGEIRGDSRAFDFEYTPDVAGSFLFTAVVDAAEGEVVVQNNSAERDVKVIDDFLRVLFVEYEPTWEWRFLKEVFHRDKLVGLRGFRTFLRSADPIVRETNELFLPSLTLPRGQFFENDVIFLGDVPAAALSTRFCEMTREFVSQFGGGLVVMAGPRFGPGQLAETPLVEMLPVVVDRDAKRQDEQEFRLALTSAVPQYDFMRLGETDADNEQAWSNLGKLPWYQPVRRVETRGTRVLAEHPTDTCVDGQTHQPLIAIRQYGRGEVVYIGFNEMWRLRRLHGEEFYRQFWGQLIHRLGLSHAVGSHKRFIVRTDKTHYRPDEQVLVTVEAFDKEFHPLDETQVSRRQLIGELIEPGPASGATSPIQVAQLRPGLFETHLPVFREGEYRLRVTDPITNEPNEIRFEVTDISIERRNPVRNAALQKSLADETSARTYDLNTVDQFLDDFPPQRRKQTSIEIISLWDNWAVFGLLTTLLVAEWLTRKWAHLS